MHAILLLAAGASTRMGQSKQLLPVEGEPLLVRSVKTALATAPVVVVVLGARFLEHQEVLRNYAVVIIENKEWEKGMGCSLKKGLSQLLEQRDDVDTLTVMVCDQPGVSTSHLNKLIEVSRVSSKSVIASSYAGVIGVPALFKKDRFVDLLGIGDDGGASKFIRQWPQWVEAVDFPEGVIDLDTPTDYSSYTSSE